MKNILQKKSLILSIIIFIVFLVVFLFLYKEINNNKNISQSMQENWQVEATRREEASSLVNSIRAIAPERAALDSHFVQSSDVVPFLDTVERLARGVDTKVEITSVEVAKDNASLMVEAKASGSFENVYKLIMLLENSPYNLEFVLVDIKNVSAQDATISKNAQWTATFQIKLLSFINK